ncbi:hypothetical protein KOW79_021525 [Hemibagrus wyckioides]|uniref:Ig-like domain-containing protein n=1 Tax=Hemibagrus wyckioides TaxID=337641 RepID=A0A9D3N6S9_9TELE|nr:myelin-oligodendrocyte glycoprotein-like [Hemibagrus wyckioides]KAG7315437.1 hypothetical protein KOW79_021525 [Hemibagrus wyckioides]
MPNPNLRTISKRCILFLLIQLLIYNVLVQNNEIRTAEEGDTVILPCSVDPTAAGGDVFWRNEEEHQVVVDIIMGKEDFNDQSPKYRGRVKTFTTEIAEGNFSILLSNVTLSDSGIYTCYAPKPVQRVELSVTEKKIRPGNGDVRSSASSMFLLGFSLLYSLAFS